MHRRSFSVVAYRFPKRITFVHCLANLFASNPLPSCRMHVVRHQIPCAFVRLHTAPKGASACASVQCARSHLHAIVGIVQRSASSRCTRDALNPVQLPAHAPEDAEVAGRDFLPAFASRDGFQIPTPPEFLSARRFEPLRDMRKLDGRKQNQCEFVNSPRKNNNLRWRGSFPLGRKTAHVRRPDSSGKPFPGPITSL